MLADTKAVAADRREGRGPAANEAPIHFTAQPLSEHEGERELFQNQEAHHQHQQGRTRQRNIVGAKNSERKILVSVKHY